MISVIVPTYNRQALLFSTLKSLHAQEGEYLLQVIVVDDGSSDETAEVVHQFACNNNDSSFIIDYVYQPDEGFRVATARNQGLALALHELVVFIDAGVYLFPDAFLTLLQCHSNNDLILGKVYGFDEQASETISEHDQSLSLRDPEKFIQEKRYYQYPDTRVAMLAKFDLPMDALPAPWIYGWTALLAIPTLLAKKIGGFDEAFVSWGGEDVEFCLRAQLADANIRFLSSFQAFHLPHQADLLGRKQSSRNNLEYIHQKHQRRSTQIWLESRFSDVNPTLLKEGRDYYLDDLTETLNV